MALAFSYLRMSRPEQIKGDSLRRQLEASREYAIKHGLTLNETMQDIGVSAFRGKNRTEGTLAAFLDLIRDDEIPSGSVLLVENLDRLSREQVTTALRLFLSIIDAGVSIVTLSDGQVYSKAEVDRDFTKLLMSIVYMARAHDESAMKSARLVDLSTQSVRIDEVVGILVDQPGGGCQIALEFLAVLAEIMQQAKNLADSGEAEFSRIASRKAPD